VDGQEIMDKGIMQHLNIGIADMKGNKEIHTQKAKENLQKCDSGVRLTSSPPGVENGKILCRICGDSAVRHVHYGGHCCFSCKAFFRRAVNWQNKNGRPFQCKFEDKCEINIKNRKTCQSCRFKKCMITGMNPSWVLSEEQRKKRFKKYKNGDPKGEDDEELSPASSQDSERDTPVGQLDRELDFDDKSDILVKKEGRRRAKSAPVPVDINGVIEQNGHLMDSKGGLVSGRMIGNLNSTNGFLSDIGLSQSFNRVNRLSGPGVLQTNLPTIKTEVSDQFDMSPLRDDFTMDFNNSQQHFEMGEPNIKVETDISFDQTDFESLDCLISNYEFGTDIDVKPVITTKLEQELCQTPNEEEPTRIHDGICLQLSEEDMMHIFKLEMSFENSFDRLPSMGDDTSAIWDYINRSWNFKKMSQDFTSTLLNEAVELCLRRNLIFLQENSDFISLSLQDRINLYNSNMGAMCHVRGTMLHTTTKHDFLMRSNSCDEFQSNTGPLGHNQERDSVLNMVGLTQSCQQNSIFEISYKNHKTGKIRRWNVADNPYQELSLLRSDSCQDEQEISNNYNLVVKEGEGKKSLLSLAETLWTLDLERTSYIILLLIVLFSCQGTTFENPKEIDRFQNKYMMLLFRFLQAKHGQDKVHLYLSKIMTFVLNLLTNAY